MLSMRMIVALPRDVKLGGVLRCPTGVPSSTFLIVRCVIFSRVFMLKRQAPATTHVTPGSSTLRLAPISLLYTSPMVPTLQPPMTVSRESIFCEPHTNGNTKVATFAQEPAEPYRSLYNARWVCERDLGESSEVKECRKQDEAAQPPPPTHQASGLPGPTWREKSIDGYKKMEMALHKAPDDETTPEKEKNTDQESTSGAMKRRMVRRWIPGRQLQARISRWGT